MSQTDIRRKIPVNRRTRPPHQSPSSSIHRRTSPPSKRSSKSASRPIKVFERCNSEPTLRDTGPVSWGSEYYHRNMTPPDGVLLRPQTCTEIFSSSPDLFYRSPKKIEVRSISRVCLLVFPTTAWLDFICFYLFIYYLSFLKS